MTRVLMRHRDDLADRKEGGEIKMKADSGVTGSED